MNIAWSTDEEDEDNNTSREFQTRLNPYDMSDLDFKQMYRLKKETFYSLCQYLSERLTSPTNRSQALSVELQVAISLHILGHNSLQSDSARIHRCRQSAANRAFHRFLSAIVDVSGKLICWPDGNEEIEIRQRMYRAYNLPNIIGLIDGSHLRIMAPSHNEADYVNRKNFHSINMGAICDDNLVFRWISTSFPGSCHDSRVFKESKLYAELSDGKKSGCLIGDSAYAAEKFLIKPLETPLTDQEQRYQRAVCAARSKIENAFGCLKRQFLILHGEIRYDPETASKIAIACVCLRNICITAKDDTVQDTDAIPQDPDSPNDASKYPNTAAGKVLIRKIIDEFF